MQVRTQYHHLPERHCGEHYVEIGNLTGEFNICLPFSMIEPLRELLGESAAGKTRVMNPELARNNLVRQVQHSGWSWWQTLPTFRCGYPRF